MLYAIIHSGKCSLQKMGGSFQSAIDLESRVKKCKRWLGSKYNDYTTFFIPFVEQLLKGDPDYNTPKPRP